MIHMSGQLRKTRVSEDKGNVHIALLKPPKRLAIIYRHLLEREFGTNLGGTIHEPHGEAQDVASNQHESTLARCREDLSALYRERAGRLRTERGCPVARGFGTETRSSRLSVAAGPSAGVERMRSRSYGLCRGER